MWAGEYKKVYLAKGGACVSGVVRRVVLVAVFGMMLSLFLEDAKFLDKIPANHLPHILPFFFFLLFLLLLVLFPLIPL